LPAQYGFPRDYQYFDLTYQYLNFHFVLAQSLQIRIQSHPLFLSMRRDEPVSAGSAHRRATPSENDDGAGVAVCFSGAYGAVQFFSARGWRVLHHGRAGSTDLCADCCRLLPFHEPRRVCRRRCLTSTDVFDVEIRRYCIFCRFLKPRLRLDAGSARRVLIVERQPQLFY
ncbi:hypothetical protein ALC60_10059, partial [Trachymyrmex zeteki]